LCPAMSPLCDEVLSITRRVFRRQQKLLVHRQANFSFTGSFLELNCHSSFNRQHHLAVNEQLVPRL
jgi:hypothetical protein